MARKPRIYYPGAYYHVMLRGNGGQDIFSSDADRSRFCFLIQEGVERYGHRVHCFCMMTNHVHMLIEVGTVSLSRIIQNLSFRYTRYINTAYKKTGHLFQGRYKALLIDADNYLLQLSRYIHCNPVRAGLVSDPGKYRCSSYCAFLGETSIPWLTTHSVMSQFSDNIEKARVLYCKFVQDGLQEPHRSDFHSGTCGGRILGDDYFSEKVLAQAEEESEWRISLVDVVKAACSIYGVKESELAKPGKKQPAAEARAVIAFLVQERERLSLTELGIYVRRDIAALSRSASRIYAKLNMDSELSARVKEINRILERISKCQA